MRIGLLGTHGTGKTTLANALVEELTKKEYYFQIPEVARVIDIMHINKCIEVQKDMVHIQKTIESYHKNFVSDRTTLDMLVYTMIQGTRFDENFKMSCIDHLREYDILVFIPPMFGLVDDGYRFIGDDFQMLVHKTFMDVIRSNKIHVYTLKSDGVDNRVHEVVTVLLKSEHRA